MVWNGDESIRPDDPELCTIDTCPVTDSMFVYQPSLGWNAFFLAWFTLSTIGFVGVGIWKKTWGFFIAMSLGGLLEVAGYVGRVGGAKDPFTGLGGQAYMLQICCLTIAPACYAAGIYLCLSRIVIAFGAEISRIRPRFYTYIFIGCDFISLCLQGAGGGLASTNDDPSNRLGLNITIAGLAFQVFTMTMFMALCADFAWRCYNNRGSFDEKQASLRASFKFKGFLVALACATLLIYIRCVYRVAEMAEGWGEGLMANESYFFGLEAFMVALAVTILNFFHPGICFSESFASRNSEKNLGDASSSEHYSA